MMAIMNNTTFHDREINLLFHRSMVVPVGIMVLRTRDI